MFEQSSNRAIKSPLNYKLSSLNFILSSLFEYSAAVEFGLIAAGVSHVGGVVDSEVVVT